jgi:hypothetical protein
MPHGRKNVKSALSVHIGARGKKLADVVRYPITCMKMKEYVRYS